MASHSKFPRVLRRIFEVSLSNLTEAKRPRYCKTPAVDQDWLR